jgi:hypothetical protein
LYYNGYMTTQVYLFPVTTLPQFEQWLTNHYLLHHDVPDGIKPRTYHWKNGLTRVHYSIRVQDENSEAISVLIWFYIQKVSPERLQVMVRCFQPEFINYFQDLVQAIVRTWPEAHREGSLLEPLRDQPSGSRKELPEPTVQRKPRLEVQERAREARRLMEERDVPLVVACERAGISPKTYKKYLEMNWI